MDLLPLPVVSLGNDYGKRKAMRAKCGILLDYTSYFWRLLGGKPILPLENQLGHWKRLISVVRIFRRISYGWYGKDCFAVVTLVHSQGTISSSIVARNTDRCFGQEGQARSNLGSKMINRGEPKPQETLSVQRRLEKQRKTDETAASIILAERMVRDKKPLDFANYVSPSKRW